MVDGYPGSVAVVNAYKAQTGSSSVARAYYSFLLKEHLQVNWYQCTYSRDRDAYDSLGTTVEGYKLFRDDQNLVLSSIFVYPRKLAALKETTAILTDPVLLGAAPRVGNPIVIVHDLRELSDYRRSLVAGGYFRWLFRHLDRVTRIICVSDATRAELLRLYRPTAPVDVIHPGSGMLGDPAKHLEQSLTRMANDRTLRLLCIAADRPYKNLALFCRLAKLFENPQNGWNFRFRLISRIKPETAREIVRLRASNLEVIPGVRELSTEYAQADVLVHPSLLEGFGLPPVEAMQFGIPIIASDVPCVREVVHTGGVLVNPGEINQWASAVSEMTDPEVYAQRAQASSDRGKEFTPAAFDRRLGDWFRTLRQEGPKPRQTPVETTS